MNRVYPWVLACLALAACGGGDDANREVESAPIVPVPSPGRTSARGGVRDTAWTVSPRGIGPILVGASAREALGVRVDVGGAALAQTCAYVKAGRVPPGVAVMANAGTVARVDVDSGRVATVEGARVGDSEGRIRKLYAGHVTEQPHKYTSGHYLIVTPTDSVGRIIFETDGKVVTSYRAGRRPEVEWVERCS